MKILLSLLTTIIIIYIRYRSIGTAFPDTKTKRSITIKIGLIGIILVGGLFAYEQILNAINRNQQYFLTDFSRQNILLFIGYCFVISLILTFIHKNFQKHKILKIITTGITLFIWIWLFGYITGITTALMYIIISAYAEEYLKFSAGTNLLIHIQLKKHTKKNLQEPKSNLQESSQSSGIQNRDLIFFCLLVALGFSGIENLLYLGQNIYTATTTNSDVIILSLGRGLTTTLIHVVSTGIIAYTIFFFSHKLHIFKKNIISLIIWLILGVSVHSLFNFSLQLQKKILIVIIIIWSYFLLSYFLFQSQLLFTKKHNNQFPKNIQKT